MNLAIDLKWSLWISDLAAITEYAQDLVLTLRRLTPGQQLRVMSVPRKETREGTVVFTRLFGAWQAHVRFTDWWDDTEALVSTLDLPAATDAERAASETWIHQTLPFENDAGECPSVVETAGFKVRRLEELFRRIDDVEVRLLERSTNLWRAASPRADTYRIELSRARS